MKWLMWMDHDPKKSDQRKVEEATARFLDRFGYPPSEIIAKAPGLWWMGPIEREA